MAVPSHLRSSEGTAGRIGGLDENQRQETQITYGNRPSYFRQGDLKPNQTNRQGLNQFGAERYVTGTDGRAIKTKPKGGGGGSGY